MLIGVWTEEGRAMWESPHDILHQNVQSISNEQIELNLVLKSRLKNTVVLCFTEHWVKVVYLNFIQIDQYKLVIHISRKIYDHGGSCINVKKVSGLRNVIVLKLLVQGRNLKCL